MRHPTRHASYAIGAAILLAVAPGIARAQTVDDTFLLTTSVSPNVIVLLDNSAAMNHIEWHPEFEPSASSSCADFDPDRVYGTDELGNTETHCGNTRTIFSPVSPTLWDGRYLNWYFSDAADPYINEIETAEATPAGCNQAGSQTRFVAKYRRTRAEAAKQVILDVLCLSEPRGLRFGLAEFREAADTGLVDPETGVDPNGGFLSVPVADSTPAHAADLEAHVGNTQDADATPLGEAVFQLYSYLMPRTLGTQPRGKDGILQFPPYVYDDQGQVPSQSNKVLPDPVEFSCQKNFIIAVTTGLPTRDDFDRDPVATSVGFDQFVGLIGDYNADGETEVLGTAEEETLYLDDIVKYMQENDLRPDYADDQTVDFYAVGFGTSQAADVYLERTAELGNGLFFYSQDGEQLSAALVSVLNDIVEKSRSFTAATVPSARTADGGDFYNSFFLPSGKSAFWEGHLRSWHFTAGGDIVDSNGDCALEDPDPGECNSGPFKPLCQDGQTTDCVVPFWDAGEEVPPPGASNATPGARQLYTSKLDGSTPPVPQRVGFDAALAAADLTIQTFTSPPSPAPNSTQYPLRGSTALNAEGLADEVVAYGRGCVFGTGVVSGDVSAGVPCEERPWLLGDIFHSDPIVVRAPPKRNRGLAYETFRNAYEGRTRVIYTGTNGGFLEAIHAGTWDATDELYDEGTGVELFGFMPWEPRRRIKKQPVDDPTARTHYVDGAPQVADAWLYSDPRVAGQAASEWRTVLVGGLREGGRHYYALDVTNPDGINGPAGTLPYPGLLWEFPNENDPDGDLPDMGQTWGQPVITKVRLGVDGNVNGGQGFDRWVAIVTAGYDPASDPNPATVDPNAAYSPTATRGRGIYVLDLKTGEVIAEEKFDDGGAAPQGDMLYAIPSTPSVLDLNADGYADVIYVGDVGGNLWKWVIHPVGEDRVNDPSTERTQPAWTFSKFFDAPEESISGDTYYKNIFQPPAAAFVGSQLWLAFGTGERAAIGFKGIPGNDENNRFYAITDPDPYGLAPSVPTAVTEADLTDVTTVGTSVTSPRGYFFKVGDGQKFVTSTAIFAGKVIAATFTPSQLQDGDPGFDPCISRGNGNLFQFDLRTGEGSYQDAQGDETRSVSIGSGLPTDPKISIGVGGSNNRIVIEKSGTDIESQSADDVDFGRGVIYWREIR